MASLPLGMPMKYTERPTRPSDNKADQDGSVFLGTLTRFTEDVGNTAFTIDEMTKMHEIVTSLSAHLGSRIERGAAVAGGPARHL